jgi:hypothetical protein
VAGKIGQVKNIGLAGKQSILHEQKVQMKKNKFSETQILDALKKQESGM